MKIGSYLQHVTQEKGITQTELAKTLKVTQSQISSYYKRDLQLSTFVRICKASDLDPCKVLADYLSTENDE